MPEVAIQEGDRGKERTRAPQHICGNLLPLGPHSVYRVQLFCLVYYEEARTWCWQKGVLGEL